MASSDQLRSWWNVYECEPSKLIKVKFPGDGQTWSCPVAAESVPVWNAVVQIMESEPYLFRESAGGTYNCRNISGSSKKSLHSFGIALDLNPKKNPQKKPLTYDYPQSFITRMEGIRANGKKALTWGGRWTSSTPDAMHWQIDVTPADCQKTIEWDKGMEDQDVDGPNGEPNWDEVSDWAQQAWTEAFEAKLLTDDSHPRQSLEVEELMVYLKRAKVI